MISQASLFVSASSYEGFGLVALEAMSAGLYPVLNGNAAYKALAERHGQMMLADFNDATAAVDAIESAYRRISSAPAAMREALLEAARPYSWDYVAERYITLYKSLDIPALRT